MWHSEDIWPHNNRHQKERKKESEVAQSCPTLCDPMDCSLPDSSVQRILQARILEWVAISFSRRFSRPRDRTRVSRIGGRCLTSEPPRKIIDTRDANKVAEATKNVLVAQSCPTLCDPMDCSPPGSSVHGIL